MCTLKLIMKNKNIEKIINIYNIYNFSLNLYIFINNFTILTKKYIFLKIFNLHYLF